MAPKSSEGRSKLVLLGSFLLVFCIDRVCLAGVENALDAIYYMENYGYLTQPDMESGQLRTEDEYRDAILEFQKFANITMTGELDEKTMEMMNMPRCGMPDMVTTNGKTRRRRYAAVGAWPQTDLTFRMGSYTGDLSQSAALNEILRAFKVWSDVTPLTFTLITSGTPDIWIEFVSGEHGDGNPFDTAGGVLAHAYFPGNYDLAGDAHFDESETWTINTASGTNLFQVAAHEFGHSLGLGHSDVEAALMYPFYRGYQPNFQLNADDVNGIQYLYGEPSVVPVPTVPTEKPEPNPSPKPSMPPGVPNGCDGLLDAITQTSDGSFYAFRGEYFWELTDTGVTNDIPQRISDVWESLPSDLDAAVYWTSNQRTYFFKGDQYWRFSDQQLDAGYPKSISIWNGLPSDVDAAFVWSGNGKTYFIKGDQYYRYTSGQGIDQGYPRPLSVWNGLPESVDAAFQWQNGRTYFFSGPFYYRFNDRAFQVDSSYPRMTGLWWFGCPDNQLVMPTGYTFPPPSTALEGGVEGSVAVGPSVGLVLLLTFCAVMSTFTRFSGTE